MADVREVETMCDTTWLSTILGRTITSAHFESMSGAGGLSGAEINRMKLTALDGDAFSLVVKTSPESKRVSSANLGLPREAIFYSEFASSLSGLALPKVFYAQGDMKSGKKTILMEDLSDCVQSGYFFGGGSPLNWGKDLAALTSKFAGITAEDVTRVCFVEAARLHGKYWGQESLSELSFLRSSDWRKGDNKASWIASQSYVTTFWEATVKKIQAGESKLNWNQAVIDLVNASFAKTNWDQYQLELKMQPFTLTHGDFHPGNIMIRPLVHSEISVALLDFEVIGIGNGAQDLGQFMISHVSPAERRAMEPRVLQAYYSALVESSDSSLALQTNYPYSQFMQDYANRGLCRWIWLFALLTGMCPDPMVQYWHDQILSFSQDHGITTDNIGMPVA